MTKKTHLRHEKRDFFKGDSFHGAWLTEICLLIFKREKTFANKKKQLLVSGFGGPPPNPADSRRWGGTYDEFRKLCAKGKPRYG